LDTNTNSDWTFNSNNIQFGVKKPNLHLHANPNYSGINRFHFVSHWNRNPHTHGNLDTHTHGNQHWTFLSHQDGERCPIANLIAHECAHTDADPDTNWNGNADWNAFWNTNADWNSHWNTNTDGNNDCDTAHHIKLHSHGVASSTGGSSTRTTKLAIHYDWKRLGLLGADDHRCRFHSVQHPQKAKTISLCSNADEHNPDFNAHSQSSPAEPFLSGCVLAPANKSLKRVVCSSIG